jgi:hypothetical protein
MSIGRRGEERRGERGEEKRSCSIFIPGNLIVSVF